MNEKKSKVILVVEDERPLLEAIKTKLEKMGFVVLTAKTYKEAIAHFQNNKQIDVLWLDHYLLGVETGFDLLAYMKKRKNLKQIPIFVVTNTGAPDKRQTYLQLGAVKYYVKSDHGLSDIIKEIKNYLKNPDK